MCGLCVVLYVRFVVLIVFNNVFNIFFVCFFSVWKAEAAAQLGTKTARQASALRYATALKQRFINHPEIRRIDRQRHVPKAVYTAKKTKAAIESAEVRVCGCASYCRMLC